MAECKFGVEILKLKIAVALYSSTRFLKIHEIGRFQSNPI